MTRPTGRKIGRPTSFGPSQNTHWDARQPYYNEKRNDNVRQKVMSDFYDDELFLFFTVFGWHDTMRCEPLDLHGTSVHEALAGRREEVLEARKTAKVNATSKDRDEFVQHVRTLMTARFQSKYDGPNKKSTAAERPDVVDKRADAKIPELLLAYMRKPSLQQQCKMWAQSRPTFKAEVDQRLAEVRKEKGDPEYARIGLWNTMASEGYATASEEEKQVAIEEAQKRLSEEMQERNILLTEPQSLEEARRFMLASRAFLGDLMQFYADRCGGMAVLILAGAGETLVSQGSCDIEGRPKLLYTDIEGEREILETVANRIHVEASLVTEYKWGVRPSANASAPLQSAQGVGEVVGITSDIQAATIPAPMASGESAAPGALDQDEGETLSLFDDSLYDSAATFILTPDVGSPADSHSYDKDATAPAENRGTDTRSASVSAPHGPLPREIVDGVACTEVAHSATVAEARESRDKNMIMGPCDNSSIGMAADTTRAPKPKPRPRPRPKVQRCVDPKAISVENSAPMVEATVDACDGAEINIVSSPASSADGPLYGSSSKSEVAGLSVADAQTRQADVESSSLAASSVAVGEQPSIFSFFTVACGTPRWDKTTFMDTCAASGAVLERRKKWFSLYGMTKFFLAAPEKLEGKVDIGLACRAIEAYMALELSNAPDGTVDLGRYKVGDQPCPAYTASLQSKPTVTKVVWHKMAKANELRKPASLDLDVGVSLIRQWANQQADSRRDGGNTLERAAETSMDWKGRLAPGPFGVRLLLLTLLCWGSELRQGAGSERVEWNRLARDFGDVFNVLAAQAGPCNAPLAAEPTAQAEGGKRTKKLTERAAWMQEEAVAKKGGRRC